jgi:magnesium-transporting ATPase (P-type)
VILALSKLSDDDLKKAGQAVNSLASRGYRTIGVAVAQDNGSVDIPGNSTIAGSPSTGFQEHHSQGSRVRS